MKIKKQIVIGIFMLLSILLLNTTSNADTAIVNTDTLNLRKEASTDATVLQLLNHGQKLEILEDVEDWYKVKINGVTGFVHKDYIKVEETTTDDEQTLTEADTIVSDDIIIEEDNSNEEVNVEQEEQIKDDKATEFTVREETLEKNTNAYILPLINATKIASLEKNKKVILLDETNGWFYIQVDDINAWIRKDAVGEIVDQTTTTNTETNTDADKDKDENTNNTNTVDNNTTTNNTENKTEEKQIDRKVLYINSPSVYVRKGPGTNYEAIDSLILNAQVVAIAESGDWYKVEVSNITGYVAKRLLSPTKQETTSRNSGEREVTTVEETTAVETTYNFSKEQEIVEFAKKYLGCKYVYGGSGPSTFDCSGFTMYVFKNFGISLSHSATAQSKCGTYVSKSDLKPGDLVFFKDYETMDGIGHCGIYIGNGDFIHASSGTGYCVKISTLLSGSYEKRYETARRLI